MSGNMYEIIAIAARYLFAALMVLIVIRAWKITIVDSRRAAILRRLSPETGVCGEFLIMTGGGKVREGMRFPVIREGMIGSAAKADIRLRASGVHRAHAYFELTKNGLRVRNHANARIYNARGESKREFVLGDGAKLTVGSIEMMLILTVAVDAPAEEHRDGLFDIPDDSPSLAPRAARPAPRPVPHTPHVRTEIPFEPSIPISRPISDEDSLFTVHESEPQFTSFRETITNETAVRRTIVREAEMITPRAARPAEGTASVPFRVDTPQENTPDSISGWDDPWSEPVKKTVITKKHVDDPFDI